MSLSRPEAITKILSRNDTGETGGHMAGILIPKNPDILTFFPLLNSKKKNPRHHITFRDEFGESRLFAFIYYNNSFFGGTRNEYRLTRMTAFIRDNNLHAGDIITLHRDENAYYSITCSRLGKPGRQRGGKLLLGSTWKIVKI